MAISYVPFFASPITWDKSSTYAAHAIVMNGNYVYVAKKDVTADVEITNQEYWYRLSNSSVVTNVEALASTAKSTADAANEAASTATNTANTAKSTADAANEAASTAKNTADAANNAAATAKSTADSAQSDCNNIKVALFSVPE